uniref:Ribosomal protein L19 n=1 Tax=Codium arabicum TaxID=221038 RepID=A0A386B0K9_CODAR|nr:ribosomal protein L19 [Codium arabicum]AYC65236.1 ribosomal protein L19 [Codium arabicum]
MFQTQILRQYDLKYQIAIPQLKVGQLILLNIQIQEGAKSRLQKYKALIISKKQKGLTQNITVRKIFQKIGVEQTLPLNSIQIKKIQILKKYSIKQAKLYYIRNIIGQSFFTKE